VEWIKAEVFATILAPGVSERGAVRRHAEILEAAREAGRRAVEE